LLDDDLRSVGNCLAAPTVLAWAAGAVRALGGLAGAAPHASRGSRGRCANKVGTATTQTARRRIAQPPLGLAYARPWLGLAQDDRRSLSVSMFVALITTVAPRRKGSKRHARRVALRPVPSSCGLGSTTCLLSCTLGAGPVAGDELGKHGSKDQDRIGASPVVQQTGSKS